MLKELLDQVVVDILNIELYQVHTEWRHENVNSPYSRLYLVTSGTGYITHHGNRFVLEPGYMYLIPAFTLVDLYCPKSFCHYYIHFTARLVNGLDLLSMLNCSYKVNAKENGISRKIFDRLLQLNPGKELMERDANKPIYKSVLERAITLDQQKTAAQIIQSNAFMQLLLAPFLSKDYSVHSEGTAAGMNRFKPIIEYIHDNLKSFISLQQLAAIADLNPAYFSTLFTKLIGVPPIRYVNTKRIEKAQILLLSSDKTLELIAQEVGFADVFYFSRIFKKIAGIPPATYRNRLLFA